jgi:hypothetical protein
LLGGLRCFFLVRREQLINYQHFINHRKLLYFFFLRPRYLYMGLTGNPHRQSWAPSTHTVLYCEYYL